jgi:hypothetical protein
VAVHAITVVIDKQVIENNEELVVCKCGPAADRVIVTGQRGLASWSFDRLCRYFEEDRLPRPRDRASCRNDSKLEGNRGASPCHRSSNRNDGLD